jgi:predicted nucleotidyltransferase component of viral defense system
VDTSGGKLDELQKRVLESLAAVRPPFILGGGGALAGVHLAHRKTRDLDLFWREQAQLGEIPAQIEARLREEGLTVASLQRSPLFVQLRVADTSSAVVVDLIAEPAASLEPPWRCRIGNAEILVDAPHAILAEKLCALLERSELRDLVDIEALVRSGQDLRSAIALAPRRDSGFSPLTLAWILRDWDVRRIAHAGGLPEADGEKLEAFRQSLIDQLIAPEPPDV